ncbi:MAG: hypothetical protein NTV43_18125 [Methylococcales bacterium]|nr:hypothetical protein [Methylococcales bacterium]
MLSRLCLLVLCCLPALAAADVDVYYRARADVRKCMSPVCGGVFVQPLNQPNFRCPGQALSKECYTYELDWSALQLSPEQQSAAQAQIASGRSVLRGRLNKQLFGRYGKQWVLSVTGAWAAATATPSADTVYQVRLNGIRCIAAPCNSVEELKLNSTVLLNIAGLDLAVANASPTQLENASAQLTTGLIVAGKHKPVTGPGGKSQTLVASQFYLPFSKDAKQCHAGGCSGELCGEKADELISFCEYLPEFACYATAVCEQQSDGNCGWTPSKTLSTCIDKARKSPLQ